MSLKNFIVSSWKLFNRFFACLAPVGDLFIRCWVGKAFIASGLTKTASWSSTLLLFQYEYMVPILSPQIAASLSVCIELGITSLFIIGLGGRLPALILFIFNIMAVVSYPVLLTPAGHVGLKDHIAWGIMIMVILLHGSGILSVDALLYYLFRRKKLVRE